MKLTITTLLLALSAFTSNAQDYNSIEKVETTEAKVILREEIQKLISTYEGSVDSVELKTGEILYNTEIKSFSYKVNESSYTLPTSLLRLPPSRNITMPSRTTMYAPTSSAMKVVGGDGSGGG